MADGEMGVEVTWALSRHGFLTAIAGVILHDMACGRRGEKRDDGEGEGGRMEGIWKMTEEVTDCNSYEALRLQFSCDNVNIGNGTGWGGKRYCMDAPYNTDDGLRSIAYGLIFFNEKVHSTGEATHADRFSYTVQQAKISDIHIYAKEGIFIVEYHFINVFSIFTGQ